MTAYFDVSRGEIRAGPVAGLLGRAAIAAVVVMLAALLAEIVLIHVRLSAPPPVPTTSFEEVRREPGPPPATDNAVEGVRRSGATDTWAPASVEPGLVAGFSVAIAFVGLLCMGERQVHPVLAAVLGSGLLAVRAAVTAPEGTVAAVVVDCECTLFGAWLLGSPLAWGIGLVPRSQAPEGSPTRGPGTTGRTSWMALRTGGTSGGRRRAILAVAAAVLLAAYVAAAALSLDWPGGRMSLAAGATAARTTLTAGGRLDPQSQTGGEPARLKAFGVDALDMALLAAALALAVGGRLSGPRIAAAVAGTVVAAPVLASALGFPVPVFPIFMGVSLAADPAWPDASPEAAGEDGKGDAREAGAAPDSAGPGRRPSVRPPLV